MCASTCLTVQHTQPAPNDEKDTPTTHSNGYTASNIICVQTETNTIHCHSQNPLIPNSVTSQPSGTGLHCNILQWTHAPQSSLLKTVTVVQTQIRTLTEWQVIHPVIKSKSGVLGDGGVEEKDWEEEEECCRDGQIEEGEEESSSGWRLRSASASDPPSAYLNCGVQKSSWIEMHKDKHTSEAKGKHTPSTSTF